MWGRCPGELSSLPDLTASRESILQRPKSSLDRTRRSLSPAREAREGRKVSSFATTNSWRGRVLTQASLRGYIVSSARPLGEKRAGARHRRRAGGGRLDGTGRLEQLVEPALLVELDDAP